MRQGKSFDEFMAARPSREKEPPAVSPYGVPGVFEDDARFILAAMGRGRPDETTKAPDPATMKETTAEAPAPAPVIMAPAVTLDVPKPKRRRLSKAERLAARVEKLRAEIERLKK
ncbi:MAG: hypothetical protein IMZ46_13140 [Acidobacteria bacterium]|nr:hypothetical protein [Acidobacteriota bacterium]